MGQIDKAERVKKAPSMAAIWPGDHSGIIRAQEAAQLPSLQYLK
jgi:hypothetical protein